MSLFKKFIAKVTGDTAVFTNEKTADAYIGGMILAGSIDGDFDADEQKQCMDMIKANPRLDGYDYRSIFSKWEKSVNSSHILARRDFLDLCEELSKHSKEAEEVFIALYEVILADKKVDDAEAALLIATVQALGVDTTRLVGEDLVAKYKK